MKQLILTLPLVLLGCGPVEEPPRLPSGYSTADAALDALVQAIQKGDLPAYRACWVLKPNELENYEKVFRRYENATTAGEIEKSWQQQLKTWANDLWQQGQYKRFPATMAGASASIHCSHTLDRYARYDFKKVSGQWYLAAHEVLSRKKVDPKYLGQEP